MLGLVVAFMGQVAAFQGLVDAFKSLVRVKSKAKFKLFRAFLPALSH